MADIQPKNTDTIRVNGIREKTAASSITLHNTTLVDTILEKTASNGVRLNAIVKFTSAIIPLSATIDLGTSTGAEHIREAFCKQVTSTGQALVLATESAHAITLKTNSITRWSVSNGFALIGEDNALIGINTTDGADDKSLMLAPASALGSDRGSQIVLFGNEHASTPGKLDLLGGDVSGGKVRIGSIHSAATLELLTAGIVRWTVDANGRLTGSPTQSTIGTDSSDASDSKSIILSSAGGVGPGRGGYVAAYGNEHASAPGRVELAAGNVTGGQIKFLTGAGLERITLDESGHLNQDATNGGNLVWTKASSAVVQRVESGIVAAGTTIADATALTGIYHRVDNVASNTGVKIWNAPVGTRLEIMNNAGNTLKIYSHDAGVFINGSPGSTAQTLNSGAVCFAVRLDATNWQLFVY